MDAEHVVMNAKQCEKYFPLIFPIKLLDVVGCSSAYHHVLFEEDFAVLRMDEGNYIHF